ncbi:hypothetical protein D3C80_2000090 [compost metagenome]
MTSCQNASAAADGVRYQLLDFRDRLVVDQRTDLDAIIKTVPDLENGDDFGQPLHESVVDPGLDKETVGANAGLSGIPVF